MTQIITVTIIGLMFITCGNMDTDSTNQTSNHEIICSDEGCKGTYKGPEFEDGSDVGHQFSNHMSREVGNNLKELYDSKKYSKVDLSKITMTTTNMDHKGDVIYSLDIPFIKVSDPCDAYTAFDHRGGWGHKIKKAHVLNIFKNKDNLDIIELNTPEGLQEFWVQWRHEAKQSNCR